MVSITIYVEGGGDNNNRLKTECRKGFREFFNKLGIISTATKKINIEVCGGRTTAFRDFRKKLEKLKKDEYCLLLVDSEAPITKPSKWQHVYLRQGDNWQKPDNAIEEHLHFMVECMESWFMADKITLANYYGKEFKQNALPPNSNIENISKQDLLNGLKNATRHTSKGEYNKGGHSFELLSRINANEVIKNSSYAENLCNILKEPEKYLLSH